MDFNRTTEGIIGLCKNGNFQMEIATLLGTTRCNVHQIYKRYFEEECFTNRLLFGLKHKFSERDEKNRQKNDLSDLK